MRKFWLSAYEPDIQAELFQIGHHNLLAAAVGGLVFMPLVTAVAWSSSPRSGLVLWLGISVLANLAAWVVLARFRSQVALVKAGSAVPPEAAHSWMWSHLLVMSGMGVATGAFGALYVPGDGMHNLFVAAAFQGAIAYSAAGNSTHDLPAFLLSLLLGGVLMSAFIPSGFGPNSWQMIGLCWLYIGTLTWVAVQAHQAIVRTIRLQISNRQLANEQAQAAAQAERANRGKSEFLAAASHDLRQPVHALLLLIEALRQQRRQIDSGTADSHARQDQLIDSVNQAGQAIGHLFNDLMELSRLESGHHPVVPTPLHLAGLLHQVSERHRAEAAAKGLTLRLRVTDAAAHAWVQTDRVMLERCVVNLLSNALRYTERGGVLLALRRRANADLVLAVVDSGVGMNATDQARIFDPYVQLGNAERDRAKGLGLGLAIVRQCVQRLGLPLQLRSQPGRGSCFALTLPAALACAAPDDARQPSTPRSGPGLNTLGLAGRRVLLIDDDPMVRAAMRSLMEGWSVDLRLAEDAHDTTLDALASEPWQPEVMLCDHRLPGAVQGIDLLDRLQDRWPASRALLLTGEPPERVQAQAEDAGYPVLYKPVAPALLASTLRALLPR